MYWKYFKYIVRHKWFVFIGCLKIGQYWHGITHDLSKFLPSEFKPYALKFFGRVSSSMCPEVEDNFNGAWLLHQHRNKHHWDYWVKSDGSPVPMPYKYIVQMVVDWGAMGRVFGDKAEHFYKRRKDKMVLHPKTIYLLEDLLNIGGGDEEG